MKNGRILVTGGAGFIGNSLVEFLLKQDNHVTVFDNFSVVNNLEGLNSKNLQVVKGDLRSLSDLNALPTNFDCVFHLAADPEVRLTLTNPQSIFENNILATFNLLEWLRNTSIEPVVFTSTSAVYGDATILPTPESYPCTPISLYGASKIACESLLSAYCNQYEKKGVVIRLANIVGPKSAHGIIFDMIKKLKADSKRLEILGDGKQNKSYLHVEDCILGMIHAAEKTSTNFEVYNMGSDTQISVNEIVDIILQESGNLKVEKIFTGGVDGGRGWLGDIKIMLLDTSKIKATGWTAKYDSYSSIKNTVQNMQK